MNKILSGVSSMMILPEFFQICYKKKNTFKYLSMKLSSPNSQCEYTNEWKYF